MGTLLLVDYFTFFNLIFIREGIREQPWGPRSHIFWLKAICPAPELPWEGTGEHQQAGRVHSASFYEAILK